MKFPMFTAIALCLMILFIIFYVMFNYAWFNPDSGAFTMLDAQRDSMMGTGEIHDWAQDLLDFQHNWWGTCFVAIVIMTLFCAVVDVMRNEKQSL